MQVRAVTFGIPVRDLQHAVSWYRSAFELAEPDLVALEGIVEFDLGPCWLQLALDPDRAGQSGTSVNLSVPDATAERERMARAGLTVTDVRHFEGVVDFFELTDPDGNTIGFVTELN
jgi:predicted enzyme related to lactoylglutathione lyase